MEDETDLTDILDATFNYRGYGRYRSIEPLQIRAEFEELADTLAERQPSTVMEIGTANGGTFYTWCCSLDSESTVVSLDPPGGILAAAIHGRRRVFEQFATDKKFIFISGGSQEERKLQMLKEVTPEDVIDFLFFDAPRWADKVVDLATRVTVPRADDARIYHREVRHRWI